MAPPPGCVRERSIRGLPGSRSIRPAPRPPFPRLQDLNVLPKFRRQGIASRLLDDVEALAGERSFVVGIGVGLHPGYNAAQRLYGQREYIPNRPGITYRDRCLEERAQIVLDDDLVLHLTEQLRPELR